MACTIVVGLQWGDEGKGKIVDLLSNQFSHVVRCQGGHNAGHTVIFDNKEYHLHLIPSGILHPDCTCYIGAGVVVDPQFLKKEIAYLEEQGISVKGRLFVSSRAPLILPQHIEEEAAGEEAARIGTTRRGIGPCYRDAVARKAKLFFELEEFSSLAAPVETLLHKALARGESLLLEGAQGTLLDINFGTYPYVTSSKTIAAGLLGGAGIGPTRVERVIGILKAYNTRVGEGPFPTELSLEEEGPFGSRQKSREIGTSTGRQRRLGWFDAVLARYAINLNGVTEVALMKLDILDALDEIKICVGYEGVKEGDYTSLENAKPLYETIKGWKEPTSHIKDYKNLPAQAKYYIEKIRDLIEKPIRFISVGPSREETILK